MSDRYLFDGDLVTPTELSRRITCYSIKWLSAALRAGCDSMESLTARYADGERRCLAASARKRMPELDFRGRDR